MNFDASSTSFAHQQPEIFSSGAYLPGPGILGNRNRAVGPETTSNDNTAFTRWSTSRP